MDIIYDVIIIGGGPAGFTAAIYTSRADLRTLILEGETPGGKMTKTYQIENYPGYESISGYDLAQKMMDHAQKFGAQLEFARVASVKLSGAVKQVVTEDGRRFSARAVIAAVGTRERTLGLPLSDELTGRGISYCAVCDGAFFRGKDVVVIGGGNSALEESLYLAQLVNHVTIVIRRDVFRAEPTTVDKVLANDRISVVKKHIPVELLKGDDGKLAGVVLEDVESHERTTLACSGLFPYIGADPSTAFLAGSGILDEKGYIITDAEMATRIPGVYAAGDCVVKSLRQVVTAAGDGAVAANSAIRFLAG